MTKNHQITTVLFAIALAGLLLLISTSAIGNGHTGSSGSGSGRDPSNNLLVDGNNTGINIQTDTNQPQTCQTVGANSPLSGSCIANSNNQITQSGGILKK